MSPIGVQMFTKLLHNAHLCLFAAKTIIRVQTPGYIGGTTRYAEASPHVKQGKLSTTYF